MPQILADLISVDVLADAGMDVGGGQPRRGGRGSQRRFHRRQRSGRQHPPPQGKAQILNPSSLQSRMQISARNASRVAQVARAFLMLSRGFRSLERTKPSVFKARLFINCWHEAYTREMVLPRHLPIFVFGNTICLRRHV